MNIFQIKLKINEPKNKILLDNKSYADAVTIRTTNWLGDAVMTLPAIYQIRLLIPKKCQLNIVSHEKLLQFWKSVPWIDNIFTFSSKRLDSKTKKNIRETNSKVAVILPNSFGSAIDFMNCGFQTIIARKGRLRNLMINYKLPEIKRRTGFINYHQLSEYLEIASAFGTLNSPLKFPNIKANENTTNLKFDFNKLNNKKILLIAPGAAYGPSKQWSTESFSKISQRWENENGIVFAIGTPAEKEIAQSAISKCKHAINFAGKTNLADLINILNNCTLCLANDSGTMHLAAALGKAGVAIFGSTDPIATGPIGGKWVILHKKQPCAPCLKRTCLLDENKYKCLSSITVDMVWDSLRKLQNIKNIPVN